MTISAVKHNKASHEVRMYWQLIRPTLRSLRTFKIILVASLLGMLLILYIGDLSLGEIPKQTGISKTTGKQNFVQEFHINKNKEMGVNKSEKFEFEEEEGAARKETEKEVRSQNATDSQETIHILLNAYHRSGSSFTGSMLASQPKAFYFFEPLMRVGKYGHFIPNQHCNDITGVCRNLNETAEELTSLRGYMKSNNITETESFMEILRKLLLSIYNCELHDIVDLILDGINDSSTAKSLHNYTRCKRQRKSKLDCLPLIISACNDRRIRIIKLVRLRLDIVSPLLERDPAFKLVHLFRDPRGIMSSRLIKTSWYPLHLRNGNYQPVAIHTQLLCDRMLKDFEAAEKLVKLFPNRVKFIRYEDLVSDKDDSTKRELFKLSGLGSKIYSQNARGGLNDWTTLLDRETLQLTDASCSSVYEKLGYVQLDFDTVRNKKSLQTFIPTFSLK